MSAGPSLRVEGLSKRFGVTCALSDVSLTMAAGEVHALVGENGAGKSTLGRIIAGLERQDAGAVEIGGRRPRPGSVHDAFGAGVRIVHQELAQCPHLSVAENICLHRMPRTDRGTVDSAQMRERAARLLAGLEPGIDPGAALRSLSAAHRQIVQIATALDDSAGPARIIIMDEPTSSLSAAESERLRGIVRSLAARGITVVYISHRLGEVFACCDHVTVLRDGRVIATSPIGDVEESALVRQMIGRELDLADSRGPAHAPASGPPAMSVRSLSSRGRFEDVSLDVQPGEIVGIGGLVGAGRSELLDALFGLDPNTRGRVLVDGRNVTIKTPSALIDAGVGYVPEDRRLQGLFFHLPCDENILLPEMSRLATLGLRRAGQEASLLAERLAALNLKAASPRARPASLSGGNQQKLLIARWLGRRTRVLLLDEPTRGIDVGTKAQIHGLLRDAAGAGAGILLVSSEMPELLALSDRVLVMSAGRITGTLAGADLSQENVLRLATITLPAASA